MKDAIKESKKTREGLLTDKEEEIMQFLWSYDKPVTRNEIKELCTERTWKDNYLGGILVSLGKKGMLKTVGMVKYGKTYARRLTYAMTREEYIAKLVASKGINLSSLGQVAVAIAKDSSDSTSAEDNEMIERLEKIINEFEDKKED